MSDTLGSEHHIHYATTRKTEGVIDLRFSPEPPVCKCEDCTRTRSEK